MGIFQSRPEEPTEWAGLPAEPWQPRTASEELPPPAPALAAWDGAHSSNGSDSSISIDLTGALPETTSGTAADDDDGGGDDDDD